jgi:hypothetical protein
MQTKVRKKGDHNQEQNPILPRNGLNQQSRSCYEGNYTSLATNESRIILSLRNSHVEMAVNQFWLKAPALREADNLCHFFVFILFFLSSWPYRSLSSSGVQYTVLHQSPQIQISIRLAFNPFNFR